MVTGDFFWLFWAPLREDSFWGATSVPGGAEIVPAGGVELKKTKKDKAEGVFFLIDLPFSFW